MIIRAAVVIKNLYIVQKRTRIGKIHLKREGIIFGIVLSVEKNMNR